MHGTPACNAARIGRAPAQDTTPAQLSMKQATLPTPLHAWVYGNWCLVAWGCVQLTLSATVRCVDYEGLSDGKAVVNQIQQVSPHRLVSASGAPGIRGPPHDVHFEALLLLNSRMKREASTSRRVFLPSGSEVLTSILFRVFPPPPCSKVFPPLGFRLPLQLTPVADSDPWIGV